MQKFPRYAAISRELLILPKELLIWTQDWLDGAVAASLISTTGRVIMWQVNLGKRFETETWADYKLPDNLRIDAAYMTDRRPVVLEQDGATWTIGFDMMTQVNDTTGTTRNKIGESWWSQTG